MKYRNVVLGRADIIGKLTPILHDKLNKRLGIFNLSITEDTNERHLTKNQLLVDRICLAIIEIFEENKEKPNSKYSVLINDKMNLSYAYLNRIFKGNRKESIMKYIGRFRIELAKVMIIAGDKNFTDIAFILHFNDESHFARDFKKITGICPGTFQKKNRNII